MGPYPGGVLPTTFDPGVLCVLNSREHFSELAAPLLRAVLATFTPLVRAKIGPGKAVAVTKI
jgi:D-arabinose 1-dehydrogenase-like Zn-dependent alcohol dehydrogenase